MYIPKTLCSLTTSNGFVRNRRFRMAYELPTKCFQEDQSIKWWKGYQNISEHEASLNTTRPARLKAKL
ncbi:hypothetical protein Gasu2_26780 [Galdieria sulphuraria]|nr:hypothetical protein Gasu2_26780 [Galdieria sulphuraria]